MSITEKISRVGELLKSSRLNILYIAIWFGLFTGLAEATLVAIRKYYLNRIIVLGKHFPWMIPTADFLIFLSIGMIVFLLSFIWPKLKSMRFITFVFVFLSFFSLTFVRQKMAVYAAALLAAGLAFQISKLLTQYSTKFKKLIHLTTGVMALIVISTALFMYSKQYMDEQRALEQLPATAANMPNVILVTLDTVRAENLSFYGYNRLTTPNLERYKKLGIQFENAFSTAPWTLPSHSSMFTGRWHHEMSADWWKPLDDTYPTLAEVLADLGYKTAGFVANTFNCGYEVGLDRGFLHYEDYLVSIEQIILSPSMVQALVKSKTVSRIIGPNRFFNPKTAEDVNTDFFKWLSNNTDRPFFAFLNYYDAHHPYLPPPPYDSYFGSQDQRANPQIIPRWEWSPSQIQAELDAYDSGIAYVDQQVGSLLDKLQTRGLFDNTIIIITSDHGEEFGEHGVFDHTNSIYIQTLRVPLLIIFPTKAPTGLDIQIPVSLREIPSTILSMLELNNKVFPGKTLSRYWDGDTKEAELDENIILSQHNLFSSDQSWYPIAKGDMKSLVNGYYHYILNGDGSEELYDYDTDPLEAIDLALESENEDLILQYRESLKSNLSYTEQTTEISDLIEIDNASDIESEKE